MGLIFGTKKNSSCPCNVDEFEEDYYRTTTMDFSMLAGMASNLVTTAVVARMLVSRCQLNF